MRRVGKQGDLRRRGGVERSRVIVVEVYQDLKGSFYEAEAVQLSHLSSFLPWSPRCR